MPKYSTGGGGGGQESEACELCGAPADTLREATITGARLSVCASCAPHGDTERTDPESGDQTSTETRTAPSDEAADDTGTQPGSRGRSTRDTSQLWDSDTTHWEEGGPGYDADQLPYLVSDYGKRVRTAREAAGLTQDELATELGISEPDLLAVEQGNAATAGIGGSTITALEDHLDVTLTD